LLSVIIIFFKAECLHVYGASLTPLNQ